MFGLSIYGLVSSSLYQPLGSSMGVVFHQRLEERYRSASFIEEDPRRAISGLVPCTLRWRPPLQDPLTRGVPFRVVQWCPMGKLTSRKKTFIFI